MSAKKRRIIFRKKRSAKSKGKQQKEPGKLFWGVSARVLLGIFAGLLLLSCISVLLNPAKLWLINLLGLLFLPLLLVNLVLFAWAVKRKSLASLIPLLALLPAFFFFSYYLQLFNSTSDEDLQNDSASFRVLSYNVGRFSLSSDIKSRKECADSLFLYLSKTDSDVICLQEFYGSGIPELEHYVKTYLPSYSYDYYVFTGKYGRFGNVTLSRIPVMDKGKILFPESRNLAIYTEYQLNNRRFRVYNCHLESYAISMSNIWKALKGDKQIFHETGEKMRRSIIRRPRQVDKLLSHIEDCKQLSFVCGDFNDSPISNIYFRMSRGRKDSFVKAGNGFGATYRALWPLIRIDYIFCPDVFEPLTHYTPKVNYSDHYPIISDISINDK